MPARCDCIHIEFTLAYSCLQIVLLCHQPYKERPCGITRVLRFDHGGYAHVLSLLRRCPAAQMPLPTNLETRCECDSRHIDAKLTELPFCQL